MALNYQKRYENLRSRKFDPETREYLLERSAAAKRLPQNIKYLLEAMQPIDQKYNEKTIEAGNRIKNHLEGKLSLHFDRAYRDQGSVTMRTNIRVHSDYDVLAIINRYHFKQAPIQYPYEGDPNADIHEFRKQATTILKQEYKEVDDSGPKSVAVRNKSLGRKVDLVFCFWCYPPQYEQTKDERQLAVYLYNFPEKAKQQDFPFATIHSVNEKGDATNDGSRRGIRLLKTLKADADEPWESLKSFQLMSVVHSIDNPSLTYHAGRELTIAKAISNRVGQLITNPDFRKSVLSPNGLEHPFKNDSTVPDLTKLKADLDALISDTERELALSSIYEQALASYNS